MGQSKIRSNMQFMSENKVKAVEITMNNYKALVIGSLM